MSFTIILIIILGIGLGVFTFFIIKSSASPKKLSSFQNLLKQGKAGTVIKIAKQITAKEPGNGDAHYFLGKAYIATDKPELALMEFKKVNDIGAFGVYCPEIDFRNQMASLYIRYNQVEEALKEFILLIKLDSSNADYYFNTGKLFEERNKKDKAENYYRKAIELNPKHPEAHYKLGFILYRNKKTIEAKIELEASLKYNPANYNAFFYLGRLLKDGHDYVGALLAFEKAQRDPDLKIKALIERGGCYMSSNSFDKAIIELERAVRLSQNETSQETIFARYFLAICYEKSRNLEKAVDQWEKIYSKKPSFRDVAEKLSQYQDIRTDDKMKDYLTTGIETFFEICKKAAAVISLESRDISEIPNGCQIIAVDSETKWRVSRKMPKLLWFLRVPEIISDSTIRSIQEEMKKLSVTRSIVISSSNFSRKAIEFAENRSINLINKEKLQEILKSLPNDSTLKKR